MLGLKFNRVSKRGQGSPRKSEELKLWGKMTDRVNVSVITIITPHHMDVGTLFVSICFFTYKDLAYNDISTYLWYVHN